MRFLSSQAIPITRPFAPHLVVLEEDGNACTSHMEFLKLYFSFQWTFNSFETLPRKTLHLALPRPKFGNPITQPAPEAGFFIGKHHLWCGRGSLIERDRNSTWRQGSQSAKKKGPTGLQWVWGVGIPVRRTNWPSSSSFSVPFKRPARQQVSLWQWSD